MKKYTRLLAGLTAAGLGLSTVLSANAAVGRVQEIQYFGEQFRSEQAEVLSQAIEEMLSAGDHTDGEAIAVVRGSSGPAISGDAEMLLSLGSDSIRGAIDTEKKNGSPAADLAGQRMKEESTPFSVWKVSDSGKTTKELLEELYADPDVMYFRSDPVKGRLTEPVSVEETAKRSRYMGIATIALVVGIAMLLMAGRRRK